MTRDKEFLDLVGCIYKYERKMHFCNGCKFSDYGCLAMPYNKRTYANIYYVYNEILAE